MQRHEVILHKKIRTIYKRLDELESADKQAWRTQEYKQLEVYLDQMTRELNPKHNNKLVKDLIMLWSSPRFGLAKKKSSILESNE